MQFIFFQDLFHPFNFAVADTGHALRGFTQWQGKVIFSVSGNGAIFHASEFRRKIDRVIRADLRVLKNLFCHFVTDGYLFQSTDVFPSAFLKQIPVQNAIADLKRIISGIVLFAKSDSGEDTA